MAGREFVPDIQDGDVSSYPVPTQTLTDDGAVTLVDGVVFLNKAGAIAATIADPPTAMDGARLTVISLTAQAHTLSNAAGSGFNGGGAASDIGTFAAAIANNIELVAKGGVWYVVNNTNVTLA
jgi:hypothetical protein